MANFSWVPNELKGVFSYQENKLVASCIECGATRHNSGRGEVQREIEAGRGDKYKFCGLHGKYKGRKPTKQDLASWPEGHKRCNSCLEILPFERFHKNKGAMFGYNTICKDCRIPSTKAAWQTRTFEQTMFSAAKERAKKSGREFSIAKEDIKIPDLCPVFQTPLVLIRNSDWAPSLDRIDSNGGYTPDNIVVMSRRANILKSNATKEEIWMLLNWLDSSTQYKYSALDLVK